MVVKRGPFSVLTPAHTPTSCAYSPPGGQREHLSPFLQKSQLFRCEICCSLSYPLHPYSGKSLAFHTWGRGFCSCSISPAPKRFSCCLELRFMAQGMDVCKTSSGSMESLSWEHSCSLRQSKAVWSGKNAEEIWNWYPIVARTCSLRERPIWMCCGCGRGSGGLGWRLNPKLSPWLPAWEALGCWRLHWNYFSVHNNLAWLSAAATRACPWFSGARL